MRTPARSLIGLVAMALLAACGGDGPSRPSEPTVFDDPTVQSQKFAELRASSEYQAAIERVASCLADQGIVGDPRKEGALMPDGTLLKVDGGYTLKGPILDYLVAREKCQQAAGWEEILQRFGLTSEVQGVGPAQLAAQNQQQIALMRCMEAKGWEIPEPVTPQGRLIFDPPLDSAEEQAAWDSDYATCFTAGSSSP
jgi:hypothetical protein